MTKKAGVQESTPPAGGRARQWVCPRGKRHCSDTLPQAGDQAGGRFRVEKQARALVDPKVHPTLLG